MEFIFFYIFITIVFISSVGVVFSLNAVYSVLSLVLCFLGASGILLLLELEYLAFLILIVYVGAIAVLFLFVVIILNLKTNFKINLQLRIQTIFFSFFLGLFFLVEIVTYAFIKYTAYPNNYPFLINKYFNWLFEISSSGDLYMFGQTLYDFYFVYYLIAGFLLLVALLGAISLTTHCSNQYEKSFTLQVNSYQITKDSNFSVFFLTKANK